MDPYANDKEVPSRLQVTTSVDELLEALRVRRRDRPVGLILTMGGFHEGHEALMRRAKQDETCVVVSAFLDPSQFGPGEDPAHYPRTPERDREIAGKNDVDILWRPSARDVFPAHFDTIVDVSDLGQRLCGQYLPGAFRGYATVLTRFCGLVRPDYLYFGQKGFQRAAVARRLSADLALGATIVVCPTERTADGLAHGARNAQMSTSERTRAAQVYGALREGWRLYAEQGEVEAPRLVGRVSAMLTRVPGFRLQYLSLVDQAMLHERDRARPGDMLAVAGYFGRTRLVDNIILS